MSLVFDAVYLLLLLIVGPIYLPLRLLRKKKLASPRRRLGWVEPLPAGGGPVVWFHAVSVGEALALRGVLAALPAALPGARPLITCTTVTGLSVARAAYPGVAVYEAPYDLSGAVRRFLARVRPAVLVLVELELWPNLLRRCRRAGIPVVVANAKISPASLRGYRWLRRLWPGFAGSVTTWLAQTPAYAERIAALGVPGDRICVAGNVKFDNAGECDPGPDRQRLRAAHGFAPAAPILVAGSTHPGEEAALLEVARALRQEWPGFRLVLAPRHPERVPEVAEACRRQFSRVGFRSRPGDPGDPEVLVVDTLGELSMLYALADVAFVGGTLVPVGGHNLLEPARFGLPVVVGRHLDTVRETAALLHEAHALRIAPDIPECTREVAELFRDPAARSQAARGARDVIGSNRGSVARTMAAIAGVIAAAAKSQELPHHG